MHLWRILVQLWFAADSEDRGGDHQRMGNKDRAASRPYPKDVIRDWPAGPTDPNADPITALAAAQVARLAHQIKNRRKLDAHYTQAQLEKVTGVSRHTLSRVEAGSTWCDLHVLARISSALGLRLELVDEETGQPVPTPSAER